MCVCVCPSGDVISVSLLPINNSALGLSPAFGYNPANGNLFTILSDKQLSYDLGLRNVTLVFSLTNPGITSACPQPGSLRGLVVCCVCVCV